MRKGLDLKRRARVETEDITVLIQEGEEEKKLQERTILKRKDVLSERIWESGSFHLTWVSGRALGQSIGQIGQLADMVTVL